MPRPAIQKMCLKRISNDVASSLKSLYSLFRNEELVGIMQKKYKHLTMNLSYFVPFAVFVAIFTGQTEACGCNCIRHPCRCARPCSSNVDEITRLRNSRKSLIKTLKDRRADAGMQWKTTREGWVHGCERPFTRNDFL